MSDLGDEQNSKKGPPAAKCAYYSVKEYADVLCISEKSVRRGIVRGEIPHNGVAKLLRIPKNTVAGGGA